MLPVTDRVGVRLAVALPLLPPRDAVPSDVLPSKNVTVPGAVRLVPYAALLTVAVNVNGWPKTTDVADEVTVVVVVAFT